MKKEQTNLSLFDDEVSVYDTMTLNTENLLDAIENEEQMENMDLDLEPEKDIKVDVPEEALVMEKTTTSLNEKSIESVKEEETIPLTEEVLEAQKEVAQPLNEKTPEPSKMEKITSESVKEEKTIPLTEEVLETQKEVAQPLNEKSSEFSEEEKTTLNADQGRVEINKIKESEEINDLTADDLLGESLIKEMTLDNLDDDKGDSFGKVRIMAIGIGGCGCNAIDRMQEEHFDDIELLAIDTSKQTLDNINSDIKLLIGERILNGHGSGNDLEKSAEAFLEAKEEIQKLLTGIDMVFITGGIGRGTGSVGLVEVGKIAREMGILTIGFATLPKVIEADMTIVEQYYQLFMDAVDSNVIVENDKVSKVAYDLPINKAMKLADKMLIDGIRGISDLIINPGKINLDYADIKTAFSDQGSCIMGIGYGTGENSVIKAIDNSINSDLVDIEALNTARTIIFNITCAPNNITIKEAAEGTNLIYSKNSSRDIEHMLFGYSYDDSLENEVKVTFIATGTGSINFDKYKNQENTSGNIFGTVTPSSGMGDDLFSTVDSDGSQKPDFFN